MQAMEISRSALDVEWRRLEIIAQNLANVDSAGIGKTPLYHAQRLVSGPSQVSFQSYLKNGAADLHHLSGVAVQAIETDTETPPRMVHEPGNPRANAQGLVEYPAVDQAEQMTLMVKTSRVYEANIVAMTTARQMYSKALEIGRRA